MTFLRPYYWLKGRLSVQRNNEVVPVEISAQPRPNERSSEGGRQMEGKITVFAIENELKYARLWYPTENRRIYATPASSELGHHGHEFREISEVPVAPYLIGELTFTGTLNTPQPVSSRQLTLRNYFEKIMSHVTQFKGATTKPGQATQPHSYIHSSLSTMYVFCISAVRLNSNQPNNVSDLQKWSRWIAIKLQLVMFLLFAFLSAFRSFCQAKYDILWFLFEGGLNQFVKFSFNSTSLVTSVYCSYSLYHEWEAVKKMTDIMNSFQRNWAFITKKPVICIVLAIITSLLASLRSLFIIDIRAFSVEGAMLESSYQMSEDLFLWSSQNLNSSIDKLDEEYGTNLNSIEIVLAVVRVLRDFAYYLQDGMLWDLIGCVVFTMHCWMMFFMKYVNEVVDNVQDENSEEWRVLQGKRKQVWRMYRGIRILFEAVNNVFDPLLILFHASNVLRYAFFMENVIYPGDENSLTYVHLVYSIVKSEVTYIVASKIAQQNKIIRKWLRNWGSRTGTIDTGDAETDMNAVLDELDEEPLGLGKGDFIIHQGFHFGLLGLVSSLFVMLASKKQ